ncbi:MAG TPA: glycoside hydrolase family 2 TIM barrel-domain containing protein [Anaerolineales bacterium]|nr:glycoside hydrolase family 2 TIM barrel-domain containing protein [Anaerolineales bacterium]
MPQKLDAVPPSPFLLGVNYWPRRKAMYWWSDFDPGEVRDDFDLIADLGLTLVRLFLLWDDWQPHPNEVAARALRAFGDVCDIAAARGLRLDVTFFTGHMSGPSWVPAWMLHRDEPVPDAVRQVVAGGTSVACGYANPFTDETALAASELLLRTVVGQFRDHPAVALWNLGNEPDLFACPPSAAHGRAWVRRMTAAVHDLDSAHPVTVGLHSASLLEDNGLRVDEVFAEVDLAVMHGYSMYADWSAGPLDPDFVPFLCALTSALAGKATLMEEFGGCTAPPGQPSTTWRWRSYGQERRQFLAGEEDLAEYVGQVLPRLVEVGAVGALLWCFADYAEDLYQRPPCDESWHERHFGLVRADGTPKPHAAAVRRFAATGPVVRQPERRVRLTDSQRREYYLDPLRHAQEAYLAFRTEETKGHSRPPGETPSGEEGQ